MSVKLFGFILPELCYLADRRATIILQFILLSSQRYQWQRTFKKKRLISIEGTFFRTSRIIDQGFYNMLRSAINFWKFKLHKKRMIARFRFSKLAF